MILSEKIMILRKQKGWSQEQLAERLEVSRQAVSKWESGASVPDLDKILRLSDLFGVSTDYLLRDDQEREEVISGEDEPGEEDHSKERKVSLGEAEDFLELMRGLASKIAWGVSLCILSPICLILLGGFSEYGNSPLTEDLAGALGVAVLLLMCAAGAAVLIFYGMKLEPYEYLEKEVFLLEYGVKEMVEKEKQDFELQYRKSVVKGVTLCIVSVIPIIVSAGFDAGGGVYVVCVGVLLACIAAGVFQFVSYGSIQGGYEKLLQQGEYSRENKEVNKRTEHFPGIYWCIVTAIYLGISFFWNSWTRSWIIWPVAGVFFAAVQGILHTVVRAKKR